MNGDQNPPSATSVSPFATLPTSRASPFPASTSATAPKNAMGSSSAMPSYRSMTSQATYPLAIPAPHPFERDATKAVGAPYSAAPSSGASVLIRRLPLNTNEESLRLMTVFSKELVDVEVLPAEQSEDHGFRAAILNFESPAGAAEARNMLDGKMNVTNDAKMIVEILGRRFGGPDSAMSASASTTVSSAASSVASSRQPRFSATPFSSLEKVSPPLKAAYTNGADINSPEAGARYHNIFSPQSPIGNHLTERSRMSGKALIKNDAADDEEARELLNDTVAYTENGPISATHQQRRATASQIPVQHMAALSLNTGAGASVSPYAHQGLGPHSAHSSTMSPASLNGSMSAMNYPLGGQSHFRSHNFPPVNPADQNPPCNTLYVGNLPIDTSEEELKAMFSKQRGYKRLCFRTKQNGPMCFVEFEDVSFATKALHELYGHMLHNSVKGGIRLSFSKNPLGVRSGQAPGQSNSGSMNSMNGVMGSSSGGFTTASGPPPGLTAPPGLGRMASYNAASSLGNGSSYAGHGFTGAAANTSWGSTSYHGAMAAGGPGPNSAYPPAFMMGR